MHKCYFWRKNTCWNLIQDFIGYHQPENLILAWDFNITLSSKENNAGYIVRDPLCKLIEDIIMDWDLEDIKPSNCQYTRSNRRIGPGHIAAILDRVLVQHSLLSLGYNANSSILPFISSYHKPILLNFSKDNNLGPIPFPFTQNWI